MSGRRPAQAGDSGCSEQRQQRGELLINGRQIAFDDQVQRGSASGAVAERQYFQQTLIQPGADALFREPAEADLIEHGIDSGINGGKRPRLAPRLRVVAAIGDTYQRPGGQRTVVEGPLSLASGWSRWATATKSMFINHSPRPVISGGG